jgi:hypothetical protein
MVTISVLLAIKKILYVSEDKRSAKNVVESLRPFLVFKRTVCYFHSGDS